MAITDIFEIEVAKAIAGESASMPSHTGVSSDAVAVLTTDTSLSNEMGTREAVTTARTDNTIQFTSIRSSVDVIDTVSGDPIRQVGIFNTATQPNGLLAGTTVDGVTQTTSFDLEIIFDLEVVRG